MIYLITIIEDGGSEEPLCILDGPDGLNFSPFLLDQFIEENEIPIFLKAYERYVWDRQGKPVEKLKEKSIRLGGKDIPIEFALGEPIVIDYMITWLIKTRGYTKVKYKELQL